MAHSYTRLHRLFQLLAAIQGRRGLNAAALAQCLEVAERTVYRDLETLNVSGVPCAFDDETNGYRVGPGFFMPPVELTFEEAMAIVALLEEVGDGLQVPFLGAAAKAAAKLRAQLPQDVLEQIEPMEDRVNIDLARAAADDSCRDVYDTVRDAIARRRVMVCTYEPARRPDAAPQAPGQVGQGSTLPRLPPTTPPPGRAVPLKVESSDTASPPGRAVPLKVESSDTASPPGRAVPLKVESSDTASPPGRAVPPGNAQAEEEFEFRPYTLWFCQRAWYAVGLHAGRGEVRRLKLNRFTSAHMTDRPFAIPDDFDLRAELGQAWRMIRGKTRYRVAVRFEPGVADTASETRWHATQEEEWEPDDTGRGGGRVTLRFSVDGLEEICWWVLGYGPGATVLEPRELAEKVRGLAQATAKRYE